MRLPKRDVIIEGIAIGFGVYVIGTIIQDARRIRREGANERAETRKDAAINIESIMHAAEEVNRRAKWGEYPPNDINKMLTDLRFFQHVKAEELRDQYKEL